MSLEDQIAESRRIRQRMTADANAGIANENEQIREKRALWQKANDDFDRLLLQAARADLFAAAHRDKPTAGGDMKLNIHRSKP